MTMTGASESEVRSCIESVSMNVGSMRYAEALREAARLAPVEAEELRVSIFLPSGKATGQPGETDRQIESVCLCAQGRGLK